MMKTNSQKGSIALWVILAAVVIAVAGYFYYSANNKPENSSITSTSSTAVNPFPIAQTSSAPVPSNTNVPQPPATQQATANPCGYVSDSQMSSLLGAQVQGSLDPLNSATCSYTAAKGSANYNKVSAQSSSVEILPADKSQSYYQAASTKGFTPVSGIGDMAEEHSMTIGPVNVVLLVFLKNGNGFIITTNSESASVTEQLANMVASQV